jgi:hypothetical protein
MDPRPQEPAPQLLALLQRQPSARLSQIAQQWSLPSPEPEVLFHGLTHDAARFQAHVKTLLQGLTPHTRDLLIDLAQDHGYPLLLHPEDRNARLLLSRWGLIYPCPADWPTAPLNPSELQSAWVMPVEIAILLVPLIPVYRTNLAFLLALQPEEQLHKLIHNTDTPKLDNRLEQILALAKRLQDPGLLRALLEDPAWFDHLVTLQIVLEWHGACYPNELFSFAWGDDTVRPLAGRGQKDFERNIADDLDRLGLLFRYTYPGPEGRPGHEAEEMLVLPEELGPTLWDVLRSLQESPLVGWLQLHGGWSAQRAAASLPLALDPTDQLKALLCVLDATPLGLDPDDKLSPPSRAKLESLLDPDSPQGVPWQHLTSLGLAAQVLAVDPKRRALLPGPQAHVLEQDPAAWSQAALQRWVWGQGPAALDEAQNLALGLSQRWLDEVGPLLRRAQPKALPMEAWWGLASLMAEGAAPPDWPQPPVRPWKETPSWMLAPGFESDADVWCGYPRAGAESDKLLQEICVVEAIVGCMRHLLLDLLSGLPPQTLLQTHELAAFVQDTAALAVHLGLGAMFFDASAQLFVPIRPPSFLSEANAVEPFEQFTAALLEHLWLPAGVMAPTRNEGEYRLLSDRIRFQSPPWFSAEGRLGALASILEKPQAELALPTSNSARLRSIASGAGESDRRFWLGHGLKELRQALRGRPISALRDGHLEL